MPEIRCRMVARVEHSHCGRTEPKEKPPGVVTEGFFLEPEGSACAKGKDLAYYEASTMLTLLLLCFLLLGWGFLLRLASLSLHRHRNLLAAVTTPTQQLPH